MTKLHAPVLGLILVLGSTGVASAGDSSWLVCKGVAEHGPKGKATKSYLTVSALEHRSAKGDGRETSVTLIYGDHLSRGVLVDAKTPVKLASIEGKNPVVFTGTIDMPDTMKSMTLKGDIDFTFGADAKAAKEPVTAKLTCETLDDLAIGH